MKLVVRASIAVLIVLLAAVPRASAAAGDLDPAFGQDGLLFLRYSGIIDKVAAVVRRADGRIVVAGTERRETTSTASFYGIGSQGPASVGLAAYDVDGSVDTGFGLHGFAEIATGGDTGAAALALEASGTLLVGSTPMVNGVRRMQVQRLGAGGFPVSNGVYLHPATDADDLTAMTVQPDGKILFAGNVTSGGVRRIVVGRLNADLTFDAGGLVSALAGDEIEAFTLAVQGDGKILVAGRHAAGGQESALVVRLSADLASTDASATVLASTLGRPRLYAVVVEPDGKVIGAGVAAGEDSDDAVILRLDSDLTVMSTVLFGASSAADEFRSLARQADGKIVVVGTMGSSSDEVLCARLNNDLTVDPGFDARLPGGLGVQQGSGVTLQPDGKILVAANLSTRTDPEDEGPPYDFNRNNGAVLRLNGDGSADQGFGDDGRGATSFFGREEGFAYATVVAEPGGGVAFTAGSSGQAIIDYVRPTEFIMGRLDAAGVPDAAFGINGFAFADFGDVDQSRFVLHQADGKYVVTGRTGAVDVDMFGVPTTTYSFAVARFLADGTLDATFGTGGKVTESFSTSAGLAVQQADGKLIIVADGISSSSMLRYDVNGQLDPTFGTAGSVNLVCGYSELLARQPVVVQPDDKILSACGHDVVRYDSDGAVDTSFGTSGTFTSSSDFFGYSLLLQPDGKIVVAGVTSADNVTWDFSMVRLDASGTLDPSFGTGGTVVTDFGLDEFAHEYPGAAISQTDGKLSIASALAIRRYESDGALDLGFGTGGKVEPIVSRGIHSFGTAAVTSDGALVAVAGSSGGFYGGRPAVLARYLAGTCGNGVSEPGESCDDGNAISDDGCDANCTPTGCGNGIVTTGESCDDGNVVSGDCCDALCQPEPNGSPCDDGDACTTGATCTAGACGGGSPVLCGTCRRCEPTAGCIADIQTSCLSTAEPRASSLSLKNSSNDAKDQLQWQISKGDLQLLATYGDPVSNNGDDYDLCVFDASGLVPRVLVAAHVPAGGVCQGRPCWSPSSTIGYVYKEKTGAANGITQIKLKAKESSASQLVKGKGIGLAMPKLSLPTPLRVQMHANGQCWEDAYVTPSKNTYEQYKAKGEF